MVTREFAWPDYDAVYALWERLDMLKPNLDSRAALAICVAHNPGLFQVAEAPGGAVVATAIGTFDGRRAYLYHVAVDPDYRRQGYGEAVVTAVCTRLWARGAARITLHVHRENAAAIAFYEALGLHVDKYALSMSIERNA